MAVDIAIVVIAEMKRTLETDEFYKLVNARNTVSVHTLPTVIVRGGGFWEFCQYCSYSFKIMQIFPFSSDFSPQPNLLWPPPPQFMIFQKISNPPQLLTPPPPTITIGRVFDKP